jgi:hypothetical protein
MGSSKRPSNPSAAAGAEGVRVSPCLLGGRGAVGYNTPEGRCLMTTGTVIFKGVVHGRTIELEREPGLPEGKAVSVVLRPALQPGEGLQQSFGAWRDDAAGLEDFLKAVYRDRDEDRGGVTQWLVVS